MPAAVQRSRKSAGMLPSVTMTSNWSISQMANVEILPSLVESSSNTFCSACSRHARLSSASSSEPQESPAVLLYEAAPMKTWSKRSLRISRMARLPC